MFLNTFLNEYSNNMNNSLNFPLPFRFISIKIIWIICLLNTAACFIFHVIYPWAVSLFVRFPPLPQ